MIINQNYYDEMFDNLRKKVNYLGEEDWSSFKKWVIEMPHTSWELVSGARLWNVWWNLQESKEKEELERAHGYKGKKYLCSVCGKRKDKDLFQKFNSTQIHGLRAYVFAHDGTGICKECFEADRIKRKRDSEEHKKELRARWYQEHKKELAERQKQNKTSRSESQRKYTQSHREQINQYVSNRKQNDPLFKLKCQVRNTVYQSFARTGNVKSKRCEDITGLGGDDLVSYLVDTYEKTYGVPLDEKTPVHIDHIVPLATAKTEEDVLRLCHYTNLRLLNPQDNLLKGAKLNYTI